MIMYTWKSKEKKNVWIWSTKPSWIHLDMNSLIGWAYPHHLCVCTLPSHSGYPCWPQRPGGTRPRRRTTCCSRRRRRSPRRCSRRQGATWSRRTRTRTRSSARRTAGRVCLKQKRKHRHIVNFHTERTTTEREEKDRSTRGSGQKTIEKKPAFYSEIFSMTFLKNIQNPWPATVLKICLVYRVRPETKLILLEGAAKWQDSVNPQGAGFHTDVCFSTHSGTFDDEICRHCVPVQTVVSHAGELAWICYLCWGNCQRVVLQSKYRGMKNILHKEAPEEKLPNFGQRESQCRGNCQWVVLQSQCLNVEQIHQTSHQQKVLFFSEWGMQTVTLSKRRTFFAPELGCVLLGKFLLHFLAKLCSDFAA